MLAVVFYTFSIFFLVATFALWRRFVQKKIFFKLDLISFAVFFNVIFLILIPLLLFRFFDVSNSYFDGVEAKSLLDLLDWTIWVLCYFLFVFYWVSTQTALSVRRLYFNRTFKIDFNRAGNALTLVSVLSLAALLGLLSSDESLPLRQLFSGKASAFELAISRSDFSQATTFFGILSKEIIKNYLPLLFPLMVAIKYEGWNTHWTKIGLCSAFFVSFFSMLWAIEKIAIMYFAISIYCVQIAYGKKISRAATFLMGFVLFVLVVLSFYLVYFSKIDEEGTGYLVDVFLHRATTQAVGYVLAFNYFPGQLDFKYLSGISGFLASLSGEQFSSVYGAVIDYAEPDFADISGAMSSFSMGDAWGLFGVVGVLICPFVLGLYYGLANSVVYTRSKLPWLLLFVMLFSKPYIASGFYGFLYPVGFLSILIPYWIFLKFVRVR